MTDYSWISAAAGALASYYGARQSNSHNASNGQVDVTHQSDPYGPSAPYRDWLMQMGAGLFNTSGQRWGSGPPGLNDSMSSGYGRAGGGGGGGGRGGGRGNVNSAQSQQLAGDMQNRAESGSGYYDPAMAYTNGLMSGQDNNAYRQQASGDTQHWIDMLFSGQDLPGPSGGAGGAMTGGWTSGATPNINPEPVGAAKYTKEILDGKYLNAGNPYRQAMVDRVSREVQDKFQNETLPGINSQFSGANALGSNAFNEAYGKASQGYATGLGDAIGQVESNDYNSRMEDVMSALGIGAQLDESAAGNATDLAKANAAASASAYGADRSASTQMSLARMSALQDALGLSAGIASDYSGDQRTALGMVPELSNMDMRDLLEAFGASNQMDQLSEQERASSRSAGLQRAGLDLQRRGLDFNEWQYAQQAPYQQLGSVADIVNAASGAYGSTHDTGYDRRNVSPSYANPYLQAVAGGMAGYGWGQQQGWGGQQQQYPNQSQNPFYGG